MSMKYDKENTLYVLIVSYFDKSSGVPVLRSNVRMSLHDFTGRMNYSI